MSEWRMTQRRGRQGRAMENNAASHSKDAAPARKQWDHSQLRDRSSEVVHAGTDQYDGTSKSAILLQEGHGRRALAPPSLLPPAA